MKSVLILFSFLIFTNVTLAQNEYRIAENYYRNGDYKKAALLFEKLSNKSPYNNNYLKRLISCYQENNEFLKAEKFLLNRKKRFNQLPYIDVILGYNFERQYKTKKADSLYDIALQSIAQKKGFGAVIAYLYRDYNKLKYAIKAYEALAISNPKGNYGFQIAQIYGEQGEFAKMFDAYMDFLDKNDNYLGTIKRYTSRYVTDNASNKENRAFKQALLKRNLSNPKAVWNDLLSWLFVKEKQYGKALRQEKALFIRSSSLANIQELGVIAFEDKDFEAAKSCFQFVLEKTPNIQEKIEATYFLLKIAMEEKSTEIASAFNDAFTTFGVNQQTIQLQVLYADFLTFFENNPTKGIKILEKAKTISKSRFKRARIKLKLGEILVFNGKFNKALIYFSQVQTQFKNHPLAQEARYKVAQTSYFKNDFKWAKAQLKVLKGSTTQLTANDATKLFLTISDNQPQDSIPSGLVKYAKADLLAYQNKNSEAIAILKEVIVEFKSQEIEDEALFKLAKLYIRDKKYDEAMICFAKIVVFDAEGIYIDDAYYQMAELYYNELNNIEKAKEYYQKIIFEHANSIYLVDARKKYRKLRGDEI